MKSRIPTYLVLGLIAVTAALLAYQTGRDAGPMAGVGVGLAGLALLGWLGRKFLRRGRHTDWASAQTKIAADHAVALWKPGCIYCERLQNELGEDQRVTWVNVYEDQAANGRIRELNDGNEYTPTVIIGRNVLRNPSADEVREALAGRPETD